MKIRIESSAWVVVLALAGCPGGDDGGTATTMGSGPTSAGSEGSGSTAPPATSDGTAEGSGGASGSGGGSGSTTTMGTGMSTSATSGADSSSSGTAQTTGPACVEEQGSCAQGESCCDGLTCCAGVPVPEGQEYCGTQCPDSDYALKREFAPVDADAVLDKVLALPITTWSYWREDRSIRHLGPMAQDFKASFGLGASDKAIFQIDADGVALTSIQALARQLAQARADNDALRDELSQLRARLEALEAASK